MMNLNGRTMFVATTAADGVVDSNTHLHFLQRGHRVWARYSGGNVARGTLIGRWVGNELVFRYAQSEIGGAIHAGRSICQVHRLADGRARIFENFTWTTRAGSGTNVFDEL